MVVCAGWGALSLSRGRLRGLQGARGGGPSVEGPVELGPDLNDALLQQLEPLAARGALLHGHAGVQLLQQLVQLLQQRGLQAVGRAQHTVH